LMLLARG